MVYYMPKMTPEKRKKMETAIYKFFKTLDPSGMNEKFYKEKFSGMGDAQFDTFFKGFFKDPKAYLILNVVDYDAPLTMNAIEVTSKAFNIPLFEYVYMPHITMDKNNVVRTPLRVPVIYLNIKRTQQTVMHKNGLSIFTKQRSSVTNQLVGKDKNGRSSDLENTMLVSMGLTKCLEELNGPRADDTNMKINMGVQIAQTGMYKIDEAESNIKNKTTLNTVNVYLLGMGIRSDLVDDNLVLRGTKRKRETPPIKKMTKAEQYAEFERERKEREAQQQAASNPTNAG